MNQRYIETYREHRVLFLLPLLIGLIFAIWINLGSPAIYRSSTSLWSDTAGGSGNDVTGAPPPAAQEQTMLNELLRTQAFQRSVAQAGPLADYLKAHPSEGWGPGAIVKKLRGQPTLDEQIATALSPKRVTSLVLGPHVLKVSYDGPTPQVSYETLRVLVKEYEKQRDELRDDALNSYRTSVAAATRALTDARTKVQTYMNEHPGVSESDPGMQSLRHAEQNALESLSASTQGLTDAANSALDSTGTTLRTVDKPEVPMAAFGQHKKLLFGIVAGLFVGALVSFMAIYALTKRAGATVADVEVVRRDVTEQVPRHDEPPVAATRVGQAPLRRRKRTG
jgi:uncharacterized protein involved in exopolysaccharide biosynthesis